MITFDAPRLPVRAIAGKRGKTLVRIGSARMLLAHGFLARVFEVFNAHRTSIDVVTTSEVSVSVTLDDATHLEAIVADLSQFGDVSATGINFTLVIDDAQVVPAMQRLHAAFFPETA
ncbi:MAG: hypothetical protein MUD17_10840 [Gemmatimonadaceae bacterium]|nr:hypothetical protein [Gemmatimonadaceae bacterium]